jgi:catechol 2,3-dioxygenase-like lactoylglutathione lyase family enzyme
MARLNAISPFFIVRDVARSVAYYEKMLGFEIRFLSPSDDPSFAIVGRDSVQVFLKTISEKIEPQPNPSRHEWARWDAFVHVGDPDSLRAELVGRGAELHEPLGDGDDGLRGFAVRDLDGYVLYFGRPNPTPV